jgi:hypothetical protein
MKNLNSFFTKTLFLATLGIFALSCSDDKDQNTDITLSQSEIKIILETEDLAGVADTALSEIYLGNAAAGKSAKANECYTAEYTDTGYSATFNNCVLNGTDNVNGTVTVTYDAETSSGTFTATYTNFYVGNIKLNGSRTFTISGSSDENTIAFSAVSNMNIEMADGQLIALEGTRSFSFTFGDSLETTVYSINGNWTLGMDGDTYSATITDSLEGNLSCANIVSGNMTVTKNGINLIVGFGEGICDAMATVTYPNGATEEINLND